MQVSANQGRGSSFVNEVNFKSQHPKSNKKQKRKLPICCVYLPLRWSSKTNTWINIQEYLGNTWQVNALQTCPPPLQTYIKWHNYCHDMFKELTWTVIQKSYNFGYLSTDDRLKGNNNSITSFIYSGFFFLCKPVLFMPFSDIYYFIIIFWVTFFPLEFLCLLLLL